MVENIGSIEADLGYRTPTAELATHSVNWEHSRYFNQEFHYLALFKSLSHGHHIKVSALSFNLLGQ